MSEDKVTEAVSERAIEVSDLVRKLTHENGITDEEYVDFIVRELATMAYFTAINGGEDTISLEFGFKDKVVTIGTVCKALN